MNDLEFTKRRAIDVERLKIYANLLDSSIKSHLGESEDVDILAGLPELNRALEDAKNGVITHPFSLGLGRWALESNIGNTPDVSHRLSQFCLLLEGWELPDEDGTV